MRKSKFSEHQIIAILKVEQDGPLKTSVASMRLTMRLTTRIYQ